MSTNMSAVRMALGMTIAFGLGLGLASCDDDNGGPRTVSSVAKSQISRNTDETSDPILIDDLPLSDRDTRETGVPESI